MQYVDSLVDLIGDTPLVRLARTLDLHREVVSALPREGAGVDAFMVPRTSPVVAAP